VEPTPSGEPSSRHRKAGSQNRGPEGGDVLAIDQTHDRRWHRVLPDELFGRELRAEVARAGPMSRWVSLNHGRAKASVNSWFFR